MLVAGVVTVIFAVGFFLKYAYESQWIGPLGPGARSPGWAGWSALAIGEITRRRGYDFVAKGVTALGFAILYATVFAAHRWYGLIGPAPAYALAVGVTAAAMLYAVVLDEVAIALLSLVGGYVTPIMLSTGENLPNPLFAYVLILSTGAMLCAYWRKWSSVNILAFLGTYLLYTAWFEKFYRPVMDVRWPPPQLGVAMFWLAVFFLVFLILPVLHTLLRRVRSQVQDTLLVLANAAVVFYYLWTMLMDAAPGLAGPVQPGDGRGVPGPDGPGVPAVPGRCRSSQRSADRGPGVPLAGGAAPFRDACDRRRVGGGGDCSGGGRIALPQRPGAGRRRGGAGPGDRQAGDGIAPAHEPFRPVLNAAFGAWCFVAAAVIVCHVLYRLDTRLDAGRAPDGRRRSLYAAGCCC